MGTLSWDQTSPVSGRLVDSCLFEAGSQVDRPVSVLTLSHSRDCDKREEVRSCALADSEVSWHDHRYRGWQGFSVSGASREIPDVSGELLYWTLPWLSLEGDSRSPGFARAAGSSRSPSDALSAVASQGALVPRVRPSLSSGAIAPGSETGSVLVDGEEPPFDGGSIWDTFSGSSPVFGHFLFGVGRSPPRSTHVRGVVRPGKVAAHQSSRDEGSVLGPSVVSRRGHRSCAMCDKSTVVAYVNKQGGTVSRALCLLASRLLRWTESLDIHLDARYPPGQANVLADLLNCHGQVVGTEWSLHPQVSRSLLRVWGNPSIDLFATSLNAKLPLYCSLVPDPQAVFGDVFRHPWDDLDLYAFPPFPLIGWVVARVQKSSRLAMTLVAPFWPEKEWFADLLLLLTHPPLALPWWDSLLRQPHCNLFHQGLHALNLHAWRLSSVTSESRAFREGLLESCQSLRSSTSRL